MANGKFEIFFKQYTCVNNKLSSPQYLTHGVSQGSVLSPLLFLVFINDLPESISNSTTVDVFADDTTLSSSSLWLDTRSLRNDLRESTLELEQWTKNNRLQLNTSKTKSMLVTSKRLSSKLSPDDKQLDITTSKDELLEQVPSHKLLGVVIDQGRVVQSTIKLTQD